MFMIANMDTSVSMLMWVCVLCECVALNEVWNEGREVPRFTEIYHPGGLGGGNCHQERWNKSPALESHHISDSTVQPDLLLF